MKKIDSRADDLKDWSENVPLTEDGGIDINDFEEKLESMPVVKCGTCRDYLTEFCPCDKYLHEIAKLQEEIREDEEKMD